MAADGFAVTVFRDDDGAWQAEVLPERLREDLDGIVAALRQQPAAGGPMALVDIEDEFFVAARLVPGGSVRLLLSDVTAAVASDLAEQVVDALGESVPDEQDIDEVWPIGDLSIFTDLGMDEMELGAILAESDLWADEMLLVLARRLGFGSAYERVLNALPR